MEQVVSSPLPFTAEAIHKLNNGSVTFEEALALFNVNSSTFILMLRQLAIYVWKGPNGSLVRVDGDYDVTIYLKGMRKRFVVKSTDSFEDVIHMLEKQLNLSPGCYKLTCQHFNRNVPKARVKTASDWGHVVSHSKFRGYIVLLHLEVFASSQTADDKGPCFTDVWDFGLTDDDRSDDIIDIGDLEYDYDYDTFYAFNEDVSDENSMSTKRITKQRILSLNNGSVTFEQARASFNVDLSTFKARLKQLNIYVWKEVDGSLVRIHGGDYKLTIRLNNRGLSFYVKGTTAFEDVSRDLEKQLELSPLELSPGCYKLTFKHPNRSNGDVWLKSDDDWHFAVSLSKRRGYLVLLYLKIYGEDAHDKRRIKKRKRA